MGLEPSSADAPDIRVFNDVGADVHTVNHIGVIPGILSADDDAWTGVNITLDGTQYFLSVEQWVELQLRGEQAAHDAIGLSLWMES